MEKFTIKFISPLLYDRLHTLSNEYNIDTNLLINLAVERLLDDVELFRNLRTGKIRLE